MAEGDERRRRRRRPRRRSGGRPGGSGDRNETRESGAGQGRSGANEKGGEARSRRGRGRPRGRARPRNGRGGGRGRPRRGRFGENWWAQRWIEVLEGFQVGRRLGRGRSYARQGQVLDLELGKGFVTAKVQGSRDAPYLVRMRLSMLSSTDWKKLARALAGEERFTGRLLLGEMPEDIEEAFSALGLSLFPGASGDLKAACSCPDQANPCKHVAAVYYLLGEEFDRDPFLIFRLRGMDRGELIDAIKEAGGRLPAVRPPEERAPAPPESEPEADLEVEAEADAPAAARGANGAEPPAPAAASAAVAEPPEPAAEPLPSDPEAFWGEAEDAVGNGEAQVRIPNTAPALPRRLGGFPFWRGDVDCAAAMERIYRNASVAGLDVFLGDPD